METGNRKNSSSVPSAKKGSTAAPVKVIDWAGVEKAYCGSHQSTREIGKAFGVSHTMVAKHCGGKGLQRPPKEDKPQAAPKPKARKAAPQPAPAAPVVSPGLEPRQQRFVDEYLLDLNGTQAAIRAGYSAKTAAEQSYDLLRKPQIAAAIADARAAQQVRTGINSDALLLQAWQIAFADPRELVETRVGCCRHCWGENFKRQRTVGQRNADFEKWSKDGKPAHEFDEEGGIGFNPHRPPHPDCTECCGDGVSRDVVKDTRYLSPAAAQLYAGVKRTKDGMQVLMHDKAKTELLLGLSLTEQEHSIIFRREAVQLIGIEERMTKILGSRAGYNGQDHLWRLPNGKVLELGSVQRPEDWMKYQGRPHDFKGFDEITHFTELQFRTLIGWMRTDNPNVRQRVVAAGNPPTTAEGEWVKRFWAAWLDPQHPNPATQADTLALTVYRGALKPLSADMDQGRPEIPERFHDRLMDWVLHRAYLKQDADTFDPNKAAESLGLFIQSFGERPDANVQRKQRDRRPPIVTVNW